MATPPALKQTTARTLNRTLSLPSCKLTTEDLQRLFCKLQNKAREAADFQIAQLKKIAEQQGIQDDFPNHESQLRGWLELVVTVFEEGGEQTAGTSRDCLSDSSLPDNIVGITFQSDALYRNQLKGIPGNNFLVTLDFRRTPLLDMTVLSSEPSQNASVATISGENETWVNAISHELETFFKNKKKRVRDFLHSRFTYDFLVMVLGFPASFSVLYQAGPYLDPSETLPVALSVALYVYLVLVALFLFRLLFNYFKWVFPNVEAPSKVPSSPLLHKTILSSIGSYLLYLVFDTLADLIGLRGG